MEEESDAGDDEKEMWNDIREEIAAGSADQDLGMGIEDSPIIEADSELERET